ncbi:MAG: Eco57I restriction-modification methylase domain-containing protein, partial [Syntrophales bacterium]|nr:Eco57I restriction-modification methylase domain-containing protein [Syntrophales bacterium]
LTDTLDVLLHKQHYAKIKPADWRATHKPFHWFAEFYEIIHKHGGFDVIIGNPPYVELNTIKGYKLTGYTCMDCGNLYALVLERCSKIGKRNERQGYIVPVSSISTDRYESIQKLLIKRTLHVSSYDDRPSRLFDGLEHIRLTIHIIGPSIDTPNLYSTRYHKWLSEERVTLLSGIKLLQTLPTIVEKTFPKISAATENVIMDKLSQQKQRLFTYYARSQNRSIFYSRKVGYFLQALNFEPYVLDGKGKQRPPSEFKELTFSSIDYANRALCCINSNLFYWFVTVFSDCRHVNKREVDSFPVDLDSLGKNDNSLKYKALSERMMINLQENSVNRTMSFQHDTLTVQCIYPKLSKPIIDEIDKLLAEHYGFTHEELDFIINYDIKYRMGLGKAGTEEDEAEQ